MCAVVTEASKKDIGRSYNFIVKELQQVCVLRRSMPPP